MDRLPKLIVCLVEGRADEEFPGTPLDGRFPEIGANGEEVDT